MGCISDTRNARHHEYIIGGNVVSLNFRAEDEVYNKTISIHDVNALRKAIEMYQGKINKIGLIIKKAIYELDQTILPLDQPLNTFNINFALPIIVYFR